MQSSDRPYRSAAPLLAGVDLSTRRLDVALIPLEQDHGDPHVPSLTLRSTRIPADADPAQRFRLIGRAMHDLLADVEAPGGRWETVSVWIEQPLGPHAARALSAVYGAVVASVPWRIQAATGIDPQAWRRALGLPARLPKPDAVEHARAWAAAAGADEDAWPADEHEADALLVALAGRRLCAGAAA